MLCHYEVLAIGRDASAAEIKLSFRRQALRWHPDKHQKNGITSEEATKHFQTIQNAYEVLSDPHEKKWYDEHREQILQSGEANSNEESESQFNIIRYFNASVYSGFGSDSKSFFTVYGELFKKIDGLDMAVDDELRSGAAPEFGNAESSMGAISYFYQYWKCYTTQRSFAWADEYKTTDAPTRLIRRAMEKENKKLRETVKKAFVTEVRELVDFVYRRDPRVRDFQMQKDRDKEQRRLNEEARKREKQLAFESERRAFQEQQEELWAASRMDTSRLADRDIMLELEKRRMKLDKSVLICDLCSKTFKSTKQLQNHLVSKKHREKEENLGVFCKFSINDEEMDKSLQEDLQQAKLDLNIDETFVTEPIPDEIKHNRDGIDSEKIKDHEEAVRKMAEAEQLRLEKEHRAAEKRRERKDMRKNKKKENVKKIITNACIKKAQDELEGQRSRCKKGKMRN
ncbi:dnaj homolog subfamily c member 21-like [Plasmopara halstedii]|uniref:Dnaj homolog subfamily c member 21-like n=1 Tax=Plasmopara halstedii TaxID=4781 RepID=A0A0P1ABK7_PLAHL|nr:dnaj homolog subfamily c member 21-like [Plasmopara halstedii]CEG37880.1 dnaj homolog subfamily c member 21-like [Plasmopara halstedii]|eukprot:XP_024574249.1 dnaj homolog subfamily c member 21-like [Plasmopara halstedii]